MFTQKKKYNALEAQYEAQKIAFAPVVFQAARVMVQTGLLDLLNKSGDQGMTVAELAQKSGLSEYGTGVLLESGLSAHIVYLIEDDRYGLTNVGYFLIKDELTRVNMNFVHDVCYQGMFHLEEAIKEGRPAGLDVFGQWRTIYDALASLPDQVKKSWFEFDHYYSDLAFPKLLDLVFAKKPNVIMDIGANTGKWSLKCLEHNPDVRMVLVDLPGQLAVAKKNLEAAGVADRATFVAHNILSQAPIDASADLVWMSQFLDCFGTNEITHIMKKVHTALNKGGQALVLETFWDTQRFEAAAFSLHNTSLYFTAMANGNSKMYHSEALKKCCLDAGFRCTGQNSDIGVAHTLLEFDPVFADHP